MLNELLNLIQTPEDGMLAVVGVVLGLLAFSVVGLFK